MEHRYAHILQPVRVGNLILKNRIINSKSIPEGLQSQDPQPYPTEQMISFAANYARNGAAVVTLSPGMFRAFKGRTFFTSPFDMDDRNTGSAWRRLIERCHFYGAAANASTMCNVPSDVCISSMPDRSIVPTVYTPGPENPFNRDGSLPPEITKDQIKRFIDQFVRCAASLKSMGFDMINIYATYNASLLAKSLSPVFNQREDEYGGTLQNRARLLTELMTACKQTLGWGFPIELQLSGKESCEHGYTMDDFVEYCRLFDGLADIIQVRAWTGDYTHASSYNCKKDDPTNLRYAEAAKKAVRKTLIAPVGGFQDLDLIERFLKDEKMDLVAMARGLISDPDYGKKLYEGRGEDVVACLRCDKCHSGVCAVNPRIGSTYDNITGPVYEQAERSKRVAVIGGGPAGLYAAWQCAKRGHQVTLYEKNSYLGGQTHHADFMANKWCMKDFKDSLARQCKLTGVGILLNTYATPEQIESGHYDAVIAACGSVPKQGPCPGADGANVYAPIDVFGNDEALGEHVAVIGGAMIAVDTALYLSSKGHQVTLITRQREASHSNFQFRADLYADPNITILANATTDRIEPDGVIVTVTAPTMGPSMDGPEEPMGGPPDDAPDGPFPDIPMDMHAEGPGGPPAKSETMKIACQSVVFSAGRRPNVAESYAFAGLAPQFFVVGDACMLSGDQSSGIGGPGSIQTPTDDTTDQGIRHCTMTAFAAANQI